MLYDTQSSDHFPLFICIDISIVPVLDMRGPDSQSTLNWGKASDSERSSYGEWRTTRSVCHPRHENIRSTV